MFTCIYGLILTVKKHFLDVKLTGEESLGQWLLKTLWNSIESKVTFGIFFFFPPTEVNSIYSTKQSLTVTVYSVSQIKSYLSLYTVIELTELVFT